MLRELLRRVEMKVIQENRLDVVVRLHTSLPPGKIGLAPQPGPGGDVNAANSAWALCRRDRGAHSGRLRPDRLRPDIRAEPRQAAIRRDNNNTPTTLPAPGLPFSLVFRAEPGAENRILRVASAYEAASKRRIPPPAYPALRKSPWYRPGRSGD